MDRDTPAGSADAPRAEQGTRDEDGAPDEAPPRGGDAAAIPAHVPALHTLERPDAGADDRTTAALGDLMPTPGD